MKLWPVKLRFGKIRNKNGHMITKNSRQVEKLCVMKVSTPLCICKTTIKPLENRFGGKTLVCPNIWATKPKIEYTTLLNIEIKSMHTVLISIARNGIQHVISFRSPTTNYCLAKIIIYKTGSITPNPPSVAMMRI